MHYAQIFRYKLEMDEKDYDAKFVNPYAEGIAIFPGLISKTWMADFKNREFSSFYVWDSKEAMDKFMASPVIAKVTKAPFLKDLSITNIPRDIAESCGRSIKTRRIVGFCLVPRRRLRTQSPHEVFLSARGLAACASVFRIRRAA